MSIRRKITSMFTSLTAAITILLSVLVYFFTKQYVESNFFHRMEVRAGVAGRAKFEANDSSLLFYNEMREKHLQRLPDEKEFVFNALPSLGSLDSIGVPSGAAFRSKLSQNKKVQFRKGDVYYYAILYEHQNKPYSIVLSASDEEGAAILFELKRNLIVGVLVAIAVVYIMSLMISKEVADPIRHIIQNVRKITASNLHLRLISKNSRGETAALTQTFNDMLDRLETSFETQNNFLNKAAHELRTPLTAIIGEAELALEKPRGSEDYTRALKIIAREAEQLEHLTSSLLELAQAGYSSKEAFMTDLRIDELLFSVKRLIDFTEPGNHVQMNMEGLPEAEYKLVVSGNTNLLKLAFANIIQNACKYSEMRQVDVSIHTDDTHCIITVNDHGIGIPENELKYIFDPFFRASNTSSYKGYGVGLPLAQKIIRLHRGILEFSSKVNEGTEVRVSLPFVEISN
ncbi:sensor histidine kinase [Pinibacter aurantiacus]|uniref:histidine kinase n=1 Tax=Pinibacter aurantiacus TaxID=2851599 RepID=A0A9E2W4W2_9BACT|nr:HAMP domain-containing sensor histidine kinase [Pinibacter aurantiacus]MBV4358249.1 HAMP domain-containing histidine kinase [Pinibacter aurantiacus]